MSRVTMITVIITATGCPEAPVKRYKLDSAMVLPNM